MRPGSQKRNNPTLPTISWKTPPISVHLRTSKENPTVTSIEPISTNQSTSLEKLIYGAQNSENEALKKMAENLLTTISNADTISDNLV